MDTDLAIARAAAFAVRSLGVGGRKGTYIYLVIYVEGKGRFPRK